MSCYQRPIRPDELYHYGVKGMRWGVRRYQNEDGTWKGAGGRERHAAQQASSDGSGHSSKVKRASTSTRKKSHNTAKTVAKVAGVTLAAAALYGAKKTGIGRKATSLAINRAGQAVSKHIPNNTLKKLKDTKKKIDDVRIKTQGAKRTVMKAYNTVDNIGDVYGAAKFTKDNRNDLKTRSGRKNFRNKALNKTIRNKKWRRRQYKKAAINAAINAW